jgi:hypothetical protein
MPLNSDKPVLFPVFHTVADVKKVAREFNLALNGKKRLFIELSEYDVSTLSNPSMNKYYSADLVSYLALAQISCFGSQAYKTSSNRQFESF